MKIAGLGWFEGSAGMDTLEKKPMQPNARMRVWFLSSLLVLGLGSPSQGGVQGGAIQGVHGTGLRKCSPRGGRAQCAIPGFEPGPEAADAVAGGMGVAMLILDGVPAGGATCMEFTW